MNGNYYEKVNNSGNITGGVYLSGGGLLTNTTQGTILGNLYGSAVDGGRVINAGVIFGFKGTAIYTAGTVVNQPHGTISGAVGITFRAGYSNLLAIYPGSTIAGTVDGGNTINATHISTIELASSTSAGTLAGLGNQFVNFGSIHFDTDADWSVSGNTSGLSGTITGFAQSDTIEVTGITVTGSSFSAGVLTLAEASGSATLDLPGNFVTSDFLVTNVADGAEIGLVCFCAGTLIRTPLGEIKVEALTVGDEVLTHRGEARPIVWIGVGRILATRGQRTAATPVIVRKGALANNIPSSDLRITKGHSLYVDSVLIPVEFLVNHRSIVWDDRAQEVTIYHLELDTHDVLFANGALAESYRDDGNRWLFQNANSGWNLPPARPCAPVLTGGAVVDAVWRRLLDRAGERVSLPLTDEADLHLLIDGRRADAVTHVGQVYVFHLSAVPSELRVIPRASVPAELGLARDFRSLGVALQRIVVRKGAQFRTIEATGPWLSGGFHAFEPDNGFRWTNGDAAVPVELFTGFIEPFEVVLHVVATTRYLDEGQMTRTA